MLADYPTLFDDVAMPFPNSWSETSDTVEKVNTSEAGTDIIQVVRYNKLNISASYKCLSDQVKIFKGYVDKDLIVVSLYDQIEEDYVTKNMRMRNFTANLVAKSQGLEVTNGVWEVSFNLLEI